MDYTRSRPISRELQELQMLEKMGPALDYRLLPTEPSTQAEIVREIAERSAYGMNGTAETIYGTAEKVYEQRFAGSLSASYTTSVAAQYAAIDDGQYSQYQAYTSHEIAQAPTSMAQQPKKSAPKRPRNFKATKDPSPPSKPSNDPPRLQSYTLGTAAPQTWAQDDGIPEGFDLAAYHTTQRAAIFQQMYVSQAAPQTRLPPAPSPTVVQSPLVAGLRNFAETYPNLIRNAKKMVANGTAPPQLAQATRPGHESLFTYQSMPQSPMMSPLIQKQVITAQNSVLSPGLHSETLPLQRPCSPQLNGETFDEKFADLARSAYMAMTNSQPVSSTPGSPSPSPTATGNLGFPFPQLPVAGISRSTMAAEHLQRLASMVNVVDEASSTPPRPRKRKAENDGKQPPKKVDTNGAQPRTALANRTVNTMAEQPATAVAGPPGFKTTTVPRSSVQMHDRDTHIHPDLERVEPVLEVTTDLEDRPILVTVKFPIVSADGIKIDEVLPKPAISTGTPSDRYNVYLIHRGQLKRGIFGFYDIPLAFKPVSVKTEVHKEEHVLKLYVPAGIKMEEVFKAPKAF